MNNPNPFVPKGSLLEQQSQRRSRLKIAVGCVLTVSILGLVAMLIQGCHREQPNDNPPVTPSSDLTPTNPAPAGNAGMPPETSTNPPVAASSNAVPPPPAAVTPVTPPVTSPPTDVAAGSEYVVVQGDSLAKIAKAQGVTLKALEAANPGVDPKKLKIKQKLTIPPKAPEAASTAPASAAATAGTPEAGGATYTVKSADTLSKIAKKNGVTLKALRAANPKYASTDHLRVGEKLVIPAKAETAAAAAAAPAPEAAAAPVTPPSTPAPAAPAPGH
jgi:LysM repeat protein